jgi:probable F420-dependent oxidoreductase
VRFDVQHSSADPAWTPAILTPDAVTRFARAAERAGFASVGVTDHPAPSSAWVRSGGEGSIDPFSALGFCAAVTSTIRLLTWVLVLGYRPALLTAHQTASLDALSGGRLVLGVGTGYLRGEFRALGADFDRRRELFDETVDVLRAAWTGAETARRTLPQPLPVQPGGPPLWIHGNGPWGRERAARYGRGWIGLLTPPGLARTIRTVPMPDLDALGTAVDDLRERTVAAGREPSEVEAVISGNWPLLDVRRGWDAARLRDEAVALAERGFDRVVVVVCGDDPGAAEDTLLRLGDELVAPAASLTA